MDFSNLGGSDDDSDESEGDSGESMSTGLASFGSSSSSGHNGLNKGTRWVTKIDWSKPYIILAEDRKGNLYKHRDSLVVLEENTDWRRLDNHPQREFQVIYRCSTEDAWYTFCHLCMDQLGVNPEDVLNEEPRRLMELDDKTHWPPGTKPDTGRTCSVCGAHSSDDEVTVLEIDLQKSRHMAVCSSHTIEDLAQEGLLE